MRKDKELHIPHLAQSGRCADCARLTPFFRIFRIFIPTPHFPMPTISFDSREYRILLEMINLATYVTQFQHNDGRDEWLEAFDTLSDKVLGMADEMGCPGMIETDAESGHLIPVEDYENASFFKECADDMTEHCFWEDLVSRLSDRDVARTFAPGQWDELPENERIHRRMERDEFYWKEFETNGVENLEVIHHTPHG